MLSIHCYNIAIVKKILLFFILLSSLSAKAQKSKVATDSMFVYIGPMLPSGINRVREIMPFTGLKWGFDSTLGILELNLGYANAEATTYSLFSLSKVSPYALPIHGWHGKFLIGFDFHYYKGSDRSSEGLLFVTAPEFKFRNGWHLGTGLVTDVSPTLLFRFDWIFRFGPGAALFINFGFEFPFLDGASN